MSDVQCLKRKKHYSGQETLPTYMVVNGLVNYTLLPL